MEYVNQKAFEVIAHLEQVLILRLLLNNCSKIRTLKVFKLYHQKIFLVFKKCISLQFSYLSSRSFLMFMSKQ